VPAAVRVHLHDVDVGGGVGGHGLEELAGVLLVVLLRGTRVASIGVHVLPLLVLVHFH
jgi:hypothetical protein